jgi:predicted protein tyrosine phosphatase
MERGVFMLSDRISQKTELTPQAEFPRFRISVCAEGDLDDFSHKGVSHILSICAPEFPTLTPGWFFGVHKHVFFQDVISIRDAEALDARAPTATDIREVLKYGRECLVTSRVEPTHLLIHCTHGASRSPAAAYAILCLWLGRGREIQAKDFLLKIRPNSVPNFLVVAYADKLLRREGKMVEAIQSLNDELIKEIDKVKIGGGNATKS